jgi:hypothetical protein
MHELWPLTFTYLKRCSITSKPVSHFLPPMEFSSILPLELFTVFHRIQIAQKNSLHINSKYHKTQSVISLSLRHDFVCILINKINAQWAVKFHVIYSYYPIQTVILIKILCALINTLYAHISSSETCKGRWPRANDLRSGYLHTHEER